MTLNRARLRTTDWPAPDREERPLPQNARIVLNALRETRQPIKAYSLLERLHDRGIKAPMTVYRALDRLIRAGLVRKIESLNAFVALPQAAEGPVAFIICRHCERIKTVTLDPSGCAWLEAAGVDADEAYIEAFSNCYDCNKEECLSA